MEFSLFTIYIYTYIYIYIYIYIYTKKLYCPCGLEYGYVSHESGKITSYIIYDYRTAIFFGIQELL